MTKPPPSVTKRTPTLEWERSLCEAGYAAVAGVDEAGWGAWAGPLSVGAAVVGKSQPIPEGLRDSKDLSKSGRKALFEPMMELCAYWAVGHATHEEYDRLGASEARTRAAHRALDALEVEPDCVLLDGGEDFVGRDRYETRCLPKGDTVSVSIAAAAVLAKVVRDRIMRELSLDFPGWAFESNKGYHSARHEEALHEKGLSGIHRRSVKRRVRLKDAPTNGNLGEVRPEPVAPLSDLAENSRLRPHVDRDLITRPSTIRRGSPR